MSEEELFNKHLPKLDDPVVDEFVADAEDDGWVLVSMRGEKRPGAPPRFVVVFATPEVAYHPLVMTQTTASELRRALEREGF
ncbi:MAG: hypothetical protein ACHP84_07330 [Caulobacterales bacterium]